MIFLRCNYFLFFLIFGQQLLAVEFKSQTKPVTLIELFSSEGCSSCPPAERQLAGLVHHPDLWNRFVPVNFHVDYWNRLGWTDPYSNKVFTDRQQAYAKFWKMDSVYTPAFVSNGENAGSSLDLEKDILGRAAGEPPVIQMTVKNIKEEVSVVVKLTKLLPAKEYQVYVALLGNGLISNVNAGENKGKTLIQNFVALKYEERIFSGKDTTFILKKPEKSSATQFSVAAWVTEKNQMRPLQAVGGYL